MERLTQNKLKGFPVEDYDVFVFNEQDVLELTQIALESKEQKAQLGSGIFDISDPAITRHFHELGV